MGRKYEMTRDVGKIHWGQNEAEATEREVKKAISPKIYIFFNLEINLSR